MSVEQSILTDMLPALVTIGKWLQLTQLSVSMSCQFVQLQGSLNDNFASERLMLLSSATLVLIARVQPHVVVHWHLLGHALSIGVASEIEARLNVHVWQISAHMSCVAVL